MPNWSRSWSTAAFPFSFLSNSSLLPGELKAQFRTEVLLPADGFPSAAETVFLFWQSLAPRFPTRS